MEWTPLSVFVFSLTHLDENRRFVTSSPVLWNGHAVTSLNGSLYVAGGRDIKKTKRIYNEVYRWTISQVVWKSLQSEAIASIVAAKNFIMAFVNSLTFVYVSMLVSTHCCSGEAVFCLSCVEGLPRLRNQCVSLVVAGMGLNPIRSHFLWQPVADLDFDFMSSIFFNDGSIMNHQKLSFSFFSSLRSILS